MKVSGLSILSRKVLVTRQFGADAWRALFADIAGRHASFRQPITATSAIPLPEYLAFHDELVRRFHPGGAGALREVGAESARLALVEGPLKDFIADTSIAGLSEAIARLWQRYFSDTASRCEAVFDGRDIELHVHTLPAWHPYFEHVVVGYVKELLELHCANPISAERLTHGQGCEYRYRLAMDVTPAAAPSRAPRVTGERRRERERVLTDREFEVLRLVGIGKTNREIGFLLGISPKTVQHHVMHAYDKVGIYTRAGAALWLAERGLVA